MKESYPILEFDSTVPAVIEPSRVITPRDVPQHCVVCFFQDVIQALCEEGRAAEILSLKSEIGRHPVYEIEVEGKRLAILHPGVGAPLAAAFLEEAIAFGLRKFIACGGAGVLDSSIAAGHLVVPSSAIRDEGTSYHYLPPGREVEASPEGLTAIVETLRRNAIDYVVAKTWTTDAIYRETRRKLELRKAEGCLTVEMEAAAFFAVARFRDVTFAQILYGGDDISGEEWDSRDWTTHSAREKVFWLAAEACLSL